MSFSWLHCWLCFRRDAQVQSMEQTLKHAEKNLGEICSILASYTRKTAKLRDKADLLVAQLFDFSTTEGPEFQVGLKNLAEDLAMVQDYRQAQVERLETRVVAPLKAYGDIIKNKKVSLLADLNREQKELQKLEKVRQRSPADRQTIVSFIDAHSTKRLEETVVNFQGQKLEDIKKIFLDFITVEMHFHAKALEVYTHTHYNLEAMDAQKDLQVDYADNNACLGWNISTFILSPHSNLKRQAGMEEEEEEKVEQEEEEEEEDEEESEAETELRARTSRQSYAAQYAQMYRWQK
uniref:Protein FAM92B-like n=1 Tax=Kryptolebias marmoratus TaxID=37003 RepID=A0A3Q2ZAD8_KRYMA